MRVHTFNLARRIGVVLRRHAEGVAQRAGGGIPHGRPPAYAESRHSRRAYFPRGGNPVAFLAGFVALAVAGKKRGISAPGEACPRLPGDGREDACPRRKPGDEVIGVLRHPRRGRGLWAAALLLAAMSLGASVAQAQQLQERPLTVADIAVLEERMRSMQAESRRENEALRDYVQSELKLLRAYIDTAIAQSETRMIIWIVGFNFAFAALLLAILPFYIALLRRVMPGLFGPLPRRRAESGGGRTAERGKIEAHPGA